MNVITRESALHENAPFMSGVIVNACSADARFIGSLNVTTIVGVRFVPAPRGDPMTTTGRVTATIVHVSLPAGGRPHIPRPVPLEGPDRVPGPAPPPPTRRRGVGGGGAGGLG